MALPCSSLLPRTRLRLAQLGCRSAWLRTSALALVFAAAWTGCENDPQDVAQFFREGPPDAEVMTQFEMVYSDSAVVKVRISGPLMLSYLEGTEQVQEFPEGMLVEFFDEATGTVASTLASRYGVRYALEERVVVRDSVVWQSLVNGDRLDTEELIWLEPEGRIYSDRFVRMRQADKVITGLGFESNQDFTETRVRAIQGVIRGAAAPN